MTTDQAIKILNGAIKKPNTIDGYLGQAVTMAIEALKNEPEIIRCKDCYYWDNEGDNPYGFCLAMKHCHYSSKWSVEIRRRYKGDFFCADGELRGEHNE